jgi:hypothetical protein
MQLIVENEQIRRRRRLRERRRLEQFGEADVEHASEHLVHRDEGGRHAPRTSEKRPAADAEPPARFVGEVFDARLDPPLLVRLRGGHVLTV